MTAHQRNLSASIDPVKLDRLAEVAIKVGLRLQPGQDLLLTAPSVALPLVRRIAEHAYKAGAGLVTPFLSDEEITLSRYRFGHNDSFDRAAGWLYEGMAKAFAANTARLAIVGDNPMLLSGEDPTKVARASKANSIAYQPALEKIVNFETNWNIIAYPSPAWAKQVFPDVSEDVAVAKLADAIFAASGETQRRTAPADRMAERAAVPRAAIFRPRHRPDDRPGRWPRMGRRRVDGQERNHLQRQYSNRGGIHHAALPAGEWTCRLFQAAVLPGYADRQHRGTF
jgi:hypothetical protein